MTLTAAVVQGVCRGMDAPSAAPRMIGAEVTPTLFLISRVSSDMTWMATVRRWRDRTAHRILCKLDRYRRDRPFRFATVRCTTFPSAHAIADRSLYITANSRLCKWASFRCPGGCGKTVRLQLAPSASPRWTIKTDWLGRATIFPSILQLTRCGCHFWVEDGCVNWCVDSTVSVLSRSDVPPCLRPPPAVME